MRNNRLIFGLLLALIVMVLIKIGLSSIPKSAPEVNTYKNWWQNIKPDEVNTLTISKGSEKIIFDRQTDKSWKINKDYQALSDNLDSLLNSLITIDSPELVAENINQYEKLGISTNSAVLNLKSNNQEKQITIGAWSNGGRYIKLKDVEGVYLIRDLSTSLDSTSLNDWIDKTIVKIDPASVNKITWNRGKQTYHIEKKDSDWVNNKNEKLDSSNIDGLITTLSSLSVQSLDQTNTDQNSEPVFTITVDQKDKDPITLQFLSNPSKIITTSITKGKYLISDTIYSSFDIKQTDFKIKP